MYFELLKKRKNRFAVYAIIIAVALGVGSFIVHASNQKIAALEIVQKVEGESFQGAFVKYKALSQKITEYQAKGVDVTDPLKNKEEIKQLLINHAYPEAETLIVSTDALLDSLLTQKEEADKETAAEEERQKGTVQGKVTAEGVAISSVKVLLVAADGAEAGSATTSSEGDYSITLKGATYTIKVTHSGYNSYQKSIEVKAQETVTHTIQLVKATPATPKPTPAPTTASESTSYSSYERKTVSTSRGLFTVDVLSVDLGSGKVRVITDTAADGDCSDSCPTKSLGSYVSQHGGFGGINGTYFCPADYADCAGKTNTFYWKIYNSRLGKIINETNGSGVDDPVFVFTPDNKARYFAHWKDYVASGIKIVAGINSKPALVHGGSIVLQDSQLDDKQRTVRSNRGALAQKGDMFYGIIAKSATVTDLAAIAQAMGADSAINIDGGGSSALYYKGSYKVGPGRGLPNAVIFDD